MKVTDLAFTGYAVSDVTRAKAFYEGLLGLQPSREFGDGQWTEYDLGPNTLALISGNTKDWPPGSTGVAVALEVDDFEGFVQKARDEKAKIVFEPYESPVCWMVVLEDPDGNRVVLHKCKPGHPEWGR